MKKVSPIRKENGAVIYNFNSDQANSDPIRTARLMDKVNAGDKKAIAALAKLENAPMFWEGEDVV